MIRISSEEGKVKNREEEGQTRKSSTSIELEPGRGEEGSLVLESVKDWTWKELVQKELDHYFFEVTLSQMNPIQSAIETRMNLASVLGQRIRKKWATRGSLSREILILLIPPQIPLDIKIIIMAFWEHFYSTVCSEELEFRTSHENLQDPRLLRLSLDPISLEFQTDSQRLGVFLDPALARIT